MKIRRVTLKDWSFKTFAEDAWRAAQDPPKEDGDGHTYVVRNILGQYVTGVLGEGGGLMFSERMKSAKPFYDGQVAWSVASRSIYPAEVFLVVEPKRFPPHKARAMACEKAKKRKAKREKRERTPATAKADAPPKAHKAPTAEAPHEVASAIETVSSGSPPSGDEA